MRTWFNRILVNNGCIECVYINHIRILRVGDVDLQNTLGLYAHDIFVCVHWCFWMGRIGGLSDRVGWSRVFEE